MSDMMVNQVRVDFTGDPEGLIAAYDSAADAAQSSMERLKAQAQTAADSLDSTGSSAQGLAVRLDAIGGATDGMADEIDAAMDSAAGSLDRVSESAEGASLKVKSVGASAEESAGKTSALSSKFSEFGKFAALGIAGAVVGAIDLANKFDDIVASIAAATGTSVASAQRIGDAFLGLGDTFIFSGDQLASAYADAAGQFTALTGKAFDAKQALDVMGASATGAEATGESLDGVTKALAGTLQAFGLGASASSSAMDSLYAAGKVTGMGIEGVASSLDKLRSKLGTAAPSLQQSAGLLDDLTQHGETGRAAMTALSSAYTSLLAPTKAVTTAQFEAGVTFVNSHGQLDSFGQIIAKVRPLIDHMGNAQATATLKALGFGSASSKLVSTIDAGQGAYEEATRAVSKTGLAQDAAAKATDTLKGEFEKARAGVVDVAISLGEKLMPVIASVVSALTRATSFVVNHRVALIALATVVGGVVVTAIASWVTGLVAGAIAAAAAVAPTTAFGASAAAAAISVDSMALPIAAIVAAVAVLGVAIYELVKHWSAVWGAIKSVAGDAWHFIDNDVLHPIEAAFEWVVNEVKAHWELLGEILLAPIAPVLAVFLRFHKQIIGFFEDIPKHVGDVVDHIASFFKGLPGKIYAAIGSIMGIGVHIIQGLWNGIKSVGSWLYDQIKNFVKSFVESPIKDVLSIFSPSRVMMGHGVNIGLGLAAGILSTRGTVAAASRQLALAANSGVSAASLNAFAGMGAGAPSVGPQSSGSQSGGTMTVQLMLDGNSFAEAIIPDVHNALLARKRVQGNLRLA